MIERLRIERFGLFRDREFALGPVTVFIGSNEAGKTTIFDALVEGVCDPSEATTHGKKVKQRYGDRSQRIAAVDPAPAESPDAAEFLSVHAIRSGDADLRMATKNWLERLRASLFSSGLNLASIAEAVSADARKAGRKRNELEDERDSAHRAVAEKQCERDEVLAQRGSLDTVSGEIEELKRHAETLHDEISGTAAAIGRQRRSADRRRLVGLLEEIGLFHQDERELRTLEPVEQDWSARIAAVRAAETEARYRHSQAEGMQVAVISQAEEAGERAALAERDAQEAEGLRGKYAVLQVRLEQAPAAGSVTRVKWSMTLLALGGAVLVGAMAAWSLLGGAPGALAMVAGVVLGVVVVVRARRQVFESDSSARDAFLSARSAEFENLRQRPVAAPGIEGLTIEVGAALHECAARIEAAAQARRVRDTVGGRVRDSAADVVRAHTELSAAEEQVARLFREIGVADEADLRAKKERCDGLRRALEARRGRLQSAQDEVGMTSVTALASYLSARLDGEPSPQVERELTPAELQRLEEELASRRTAFDALRDELRLREKRHAGHEGELRGTLGKLPEDIAEAERRVARLEADVAAQRLEERAHELAASVFEDVARDTQDTVRQLAADAARRLGSLLGAAREVVIAEIEDPSTFRAVDAGGTMRAIDLLSRGTRDALLFAVRLALAEQLSGPVPILLLDEPFGALDPDRVRRLLALLRDFRERLGFQLVFFTKEPTLRDAVREVFPVAVVHDLDA